MSSTANRINGIASGQWVNLRSYQIVGADNADFLDLGGFPIKNSSNQFALAKFPLQQCFSVSAESHQVKGRLAKV
jgi:hypothetical protein